MKKILLLSWAMVLFLGIGGVANATLWDRGDGLIYDDFLDITWLQDANYGAGSSFDDGVVTTDGRMTWDSAMAWAANLEYAGYDDWRLPDSYNQDGTGPGQGYDVTGSEMGHMFYTNLFGDSGSFCGASFIDGNFRDISFENLETSNHYWSASEYALQENHAWYFDFSDGVQSWAFVNSYYYAWAVRDGDSTPPTEPNGDPIPGIPEPATMLLLGFGLIGIAGIKRKFQG